MSAEIIAVNLCVNCSRAPKFSYDKRQYCSNKCLRKDVGNPKLSNESKLLHTINAGVDAFGYDMKGMNIPRHVIIPPIERKKLKMISKAILKLSKKPIKAQYTHNEGTLPREWR